MERTVILVYEDNHGLIAVTDNYKSALTYLIATNWINGTSEVELYDDEHEEYTYMAIKDYLGENWFDKMMNWHISEFNDFWVVDGYYLEEHQIFRAN